MCNDAISPLINLLQAAISSPIERSRLLQQPEKLREIMNNVPARRWLFEQACHPDDPDRVTDLIIAMMQSSGLIWRGGRISPDVYSESLSRTWVWFMEHFQTYEPEIASFVTWFNQKLGWMIQEVIRERANEEKRRLHLPGGEEDGEWMYPPPDRDRWHETIQEWLEIVQNHPHLLRNCRMQHSPHVNCQGLLIQVLTVLQDSEEFSWKTVAQDYAVESLALKKFCRRRCSLLFKQLLSR